MREKKIFRSLFGEIDIKENPTAIPDYLDRHFKEKEKTKKQRQMMGADTDELKEKIQQMEDRHDVKQISTRDFKARKQQAMEQGYM